MPLATPMLDGAESNKEIAFKINAEAVKYLVESASLVKAKFIHFSTEHVFSGEDEIGYDENLFLIRLMFMAIQN